MGVCDEKYYNTDKYVQAREISTVIVHYIYGQKLKSIIYIILYNVSRLSRLWIQTIFNWLSGHTYIRYKYKYTRLIVLTK